MSHIRKFNQSLLNIALGEQQLFGDARSYSMGFTHSINTYKKGQKFEIIDIDNDLNTFTINSKEERRNCSTKGSF